MKRIRRFTCLVALSLAVIVAAAGCAKKVVAIAPPPPVPPPAAPVAPPPPPPPPPAVVRAPPPPPTEAEIFAAKSLDALNAERPLDDVFFDMDKSEVRDDARGSLQKNADFMKKWPTTRIAVEGHCDSRGSSEYNLALGSRRADAVRAYLVSLGIPSERVTLVSKGKEQPFCSDENESCWQQNRRGHFLVTAK